MSYRRRVRRLVETCALSETYSPEDAFVVRQQNANGLTDATFLHLVRRLDVHAVNYLEHEDGISLDFLLRGEIITGVIALLRESRS